MIKSIDHILIAVKNLEDMKFIFEKTIVLNSDLEEGQSLSMDHISFKKPMRGINANEYKNVVGKKLKLSMKKNDVLTWDHLS